MKIHKDDPIAKIIGSIQQLDSNLVCATPVHPGRDGRPINLFGGLISATWLYGLKEVQIVIVGA